MSKVWFITGATSGFGTTVTEAAIARGDVVVATAVSLIIRPYAPAAASLTAPQRNPSKPAFKRLAELGATMLQLDITDSDAAIAAVVAEAVRRHGRIDILLNNAGYALEGAVEEVSREEAQAQFDTNVFGQLAVLRAVLPVMRAQRAGVVANMGSLVGWRSFPIVGIYGASKYAVAGFSVTLRDEMAGLGIDVTTIEPGYFRTNFLEDGHKIIAAIATLAMRTLSNTASKGRP